MKEFMDENFLLDTPCAEQLYHTYAETMPIADYHCHVPPQEIAENRMFDNITQAWLGGDHYKWRLMRSHGISEEYITGNADDFEKFRAFAGVLPYAAGNPMYHWTHLELKRYFGCDLLISAGTAEEIWAHCNRKIKHDMRVRDIIRQSNVTTICTTDDPADDLRWHSMIQAEQSFPTAVLPAFRPDRSLGIEKPDFAGYMKQLGQAAGMPVQCYADVCKALQMRMDFFASLGCRAADHGMADICYVPADEAQLRRIFEKALCGDSLTQNEIDSYRSNLLLFLGREYEKRGWVMQLHFGVIRNVNMAQFHALGADTGFDCIRTADTSTGLITFLDMLERDSLLPKTVLYSLNPCDNVMLGSVIGAFQGAGIRGKIQHGSAWWFNDTQTGMTAQMTSLASLGILGNFIGMLTDSRSFLSYTRHEYFRRILCNLIGGWVENGEYPNDPNMLGTLIQDICYNNTMRYFEFEIEQRG